MFTRRDLLRSAALFPAMASLPSLAAISAANAQTVDLLKIFVPAAPGGGWDQTARTIEQVLRATAAVKGVQITNVGGAGGAVGLPQFLNQWKGQGNALMVAGMVMVGAIIALRCASLTAGGANTPRQLNSSTSMPSSFSVGAAMSSWRLSEEIARTRSFPALTCSANSP